MIAWVVAFVLMSMIGGAFAGEFSQSFKLPKSDSQTAFDLLDQKFSARAGETAFVVVKASTPVTDPASKAAITDVLSRISTVPRVAAVRSPFDEGGQVQISPTDPRIAFAEIQFSGTSKEHHVPNETADQLTAIAGTHSPDLQVELSGDVFQHRPSFGPAEVVGLIAAIVILLVVFGSLLAMGLPILTSLVGLGIAFALIALLTRIISMPEFSTQLAAMIGLGVGIDYSLFIVTRFRQGLQDGLSAEAAVVKSIATSGKAVFFAGCTVIISLSGMYLMGIEFVAGLATAAIVAVALTIAISLTLLPAVLGFVGHNIDKLHVPIVGKKVHTRDGFWYRWSRLIQRRPVPAALAGLVVLLVLASPVLAMQLGNSDASVRPTSDTTRRAYDLLAEGFGPGFNGPLLLVIEAPVGTSADAFTKVQNDVAAAEGVRFVFPAHLNPAGDTAVMQVFPATSPQDRKTVSLIHRLRDDVLPEATAGTEMKAHVGGITAAFDDVSTLLQTRLPLFIGLVLLMSFLLLMVVFRSLLVPLKAVIMNLLSIGAAYGVLVAVFQKGVFSSVFNVGTGPVESFLPMMLFAILFGLSMDYEVFLLSRVKEEYDRTGDNSLAVADGLSATARVITAAALIMVTVFGSFVFTDERVIKEFGLGLAVAILVDATVVRMLLVPATMELLGDANWWLPKWLDRLLPNVHIEGEPDLDHEIEELLEAEPSPAKA